MSYGGAFMCPAGCIILPTQLQSKALGQSGNRHFGWDNQASRHDLFSGRNGLLTATDFQPLLPKYLLMFAACFVMRIKQP